MFCRKENTVFRKGFWRNNSYWRIIFQEAPGTLAKYEMEHFATGLNSL